MSQYDSGKIVYKMSLDGSNDTLIPKEDPQRTTTIYFLGEITRTETEGSLGKQVLIKNLKLNTGTLLLNLGNQKLAIHIDYNQDTLPEKNPYKLKHKCGSKEMLGFKTKKSIVKRYNKEFELFYFKKADAKYAPAYNDAKGLPLKYKLYADEVCETYTCQELKFYAVEATLFDIPAGYMRLTLEDFLNGIQQQ